MSRKVPFNRYKIKGLYTERDVLPEGLCIELGGVRSHTVSGDGALEEMCHFRDGAGPVIDILRDILWSYPNLLWNQLCILKDATSAFPEDFTGDPDPNYNGFLLLMAIVLSLYCTAFCTARLQSY